jgi:hypothetical protein
LAADGTTTDDSVLRMVKVVVSNAGDRRFDRDSSQGCDSFC